MSENSLAVSYKKVNVHLPCDSVSHSLLGIHPRVMKALCSDKDHT